MTILLEELSKKFLLSVAVICLTVGTTLLQNGNYELGILTIALGILLLIIASYLDILWRKELERRTRHD